MRKHLLAAFLMVLMGYCQAQQFGGNPPSTNWKQINTDTARVIFPAGMDSSAMRVATLVHKMAGERQYSKDSRLKKINIVLQNQTTIGNGYVGLGPFRSEFFLTPILNNFQEGTISWTDQLALHEYRHVQQYNHFRRGLSKAMYYLFGEEGLALATNAAIPDWYYEGDAVFNETILTRQGRGRLPLFLNAYPSLWHSKKDYSWMKLRNGSYKDYVPSHYHLGYLLVNYGNEKYGPVFWPNVTRDASAFKGLIYPFQEAVKRHSGIPYKKFVDDAFSFYKNKSGGETTTQGRPINTVNKHYVTSYTFPYNISPDSLLYLKRSYRHRPAFYVRDKKGEHRIRVKDISLDDHYSYRNGKIVYAAYESHPRWGWKDYGVIRQLDVKTGKQITLSHKTKYFTPDLSPGGSKIAAVEIDPSGKSSIHILDATTGQVNSQVSSADVNLFTDPKFISDDSLITIVRLHDGKAALAVAELSSGNLVRLTSPSYNVIGNPSFSNGVIYFTSSFGGNDDLFAYNMSEKKLSRLTNGSLGNYFVNVAAGKMTWSEFTSEGYQLRQMDTEDMRWQEVDEAEMEKLSVLFPVSTPDSLGMFVPEQSNTYPVKPYRKSKGLFNFHSWRPYYEEPIFTYSLYGENILNTFQTEIYYLYNQDEATNAAGINAIYGGWFPYLLLGSEYTFDRRGIAGSRTRYWDQLDSRIGLSIPLSYAKGRSYRDLYLSTNYVLRNEFNKGFFKDSIGNTSFGYLLHTVSWTQQVQRAVQHIYPRWAYSFSANHRHAISYYEGYQFIGNAALYLPGVSSNHNLVLTGSIQQRDTSLALFSNRFASARGYSDYYRSTAGSRMWRLSGNYHLPLFIPDWGFGNILYLHRLRANVFYDHQRIFSNNKKNTADLRSAGLEFFVDTKWWNQYPLTFGIRVSHLLDDDPWGYEKGTNIVELVLPVSIIPR